MKMKIFLQKLMSWMRTHKVVSIVIVVVLIAAGYGVSRIFAGGKTEIRYVLAAAEKRTIISSISGTGQVSASNQVDLSAKASGDLIYLNAKVGQEVKAGTLIAQLDAGDAAYELETAEISYAKLVNIDADDLRDAQSAVTDATREVTDAYTNARNSLTNASTDLADVLAGIDELFNGYLSTISRSGLSNTSKEYIDRTKKSYYTADKLKKDFIKKYRTISASTPKETIESMIDESYDIAVAVAQTAKYAQDAVVYQRGRENRNQAEADAAYTTVTSLVAEANASLSSLSSAKNSVVASVRALENAERDLKDLEEGPDVLDLRSEELALRKKRDAVADYYVRAPFDGIIATVNALKGDSINSGATIVSLITKQKIAEISLNEIDAAKVEAGQKATLTFDALEDLTVDGEVIEADLVGSVSSGVVNYKVKIGFDSDNKKIKPGMTVTAEIITDKKENVLAVPTSAIRVQGNMSYVEVPQNETPSADRSRLGGITLSNTPSRVRVETGMSNDELIEIVSGLAEGQQYIARTIAGTIQPTTQAAAPSLFGNRGTVRTGTGAGANRPTGRVGGGG